MATSVRVAMERSATGRAADTALARVDACVAGLVSRSRLRPPGARPRAVRSGVWSLRDARELAPEGEAETGSRLEAEVGYGLAVLGGRAVATPWAGMTRSKTDETLRLAQRLAMGASEWRAARSPVPRPGVGGRPASGGMTGSA